MNQDGTIDCPVCHEPQQFPAKHLVEKHGWTPEEVDAE